MASFMEFNEVQQKEFDRWYAERPPHIQKMVDKFPPNKLYRNKPTGQRVMLKAYHEDGTFTVFVSGKFNICSFERNVFGVPAENLEECDLPKPGEQVGAVFKEPEEVDAFIDFSRVIMFHDKGHRQ